MITWYSDNQLIIQFDKQPKVGVSYPSPFYGKRKNKTICDKPFINKEDLLVKIFYNGHIHEFTVEKDYCWDGASIPRVFWRLIGSNTQPEFIIASMLHDQLCEHHYYIDNNRYLSTLVLDACLDIGGVCAFKRWMMKHSVDNFQKFCGWRPDKNES